MGRYVYGSLVVFLLIALLGPGSAGAGKKKKRRAIDNVAPETTITSGPSAVIQSTSATFRFTSNERRVKFQCRVDSGELVAVLVAKGLQRAALRRP